MKMSRRFYDIVELIEAVVASAPLPLYLRIEDRNSMAHSVEARLPFLDYRLVSFVSGLSDDWKIRGPWNKYVLREGMRGADPGVSAITRGQDGVSHSEQEVVCA
jgi:asparagine synthetase B (glutamine-hydrolysing)